MRKTLVRQITQTRIKSAKITMVNGEPKAIENKDIVVLGKLTMEQAQRMITKEMVGSTVLEIDSKTTKYEMEIEEFIKHATIIEDYEGEDK